MGLADHSSTGLYTQCWAEKPNMSSSSLLWKNSQHILEETHWGPWASIPFLQRGLWQTTGYSSCLFDMAALRGSAAIRTRLPIPWFSNIFLEVDCGPSYLFSATILFHEAVKELNFCNDVFQWASLDHTHPFSQFTWVGSNGKGNLTILPIGECGAILPASFPWYTCLPVHLLL